MFDPINKLYSYRVGWGKTGRFRAFFEFAFKYRKKFNTYGPNSFSKCPMGIFRLSFKNKIVCHTFSDLAVSGRSRDLRVKTDAAEVG